GRANTGIGAPSPAIEARSANNGDRFLRLLSVVRTLVRTRASALPVSTVLSKCGNDFLGKAGARTSCPAAGRARSAFSPENGLGRVVRTARSGRQDVRAPATQ